MFSISVTIVSLCSTIWMYLCAVRPCGRLVPTFMCGFLLLSALVVEKMGAATTASSSGACATCPLPSGMDSGSEESFLIEVAKKQILSKLHLRERPNITQTVPRAALLTALRKLHAGRVRQDGTLELDNHLPNTHAKDQAYEIVSFADLDDAGPGLSFQFSQQQGQSTQVLQSSLWVYVHPADSPRPTAHVPAQVYLLGVDTGNRTLLLQRNVEVVRGGWHTFPLTSTLQAFLDGGQQRLRLEVRCGNGDGNQCARATSADPSRQPFLVAQVRLRDDESKHALSKRSLRCGDDVSVCCKKDFYIKFRDIQWQDWIIAPEGYHMNYCMGQCPQHLAGSPGIASSFHATVFNQLKANGIQATISSCCVPIQRRPLSMVYFNSQHSIVKTDVPDMIVESCGCT